MSPFLVAGPFAAPAASVGGEGTLGYQRVPGCNHPTFRTGLINTLLLRVVGQPSGLAIFFDQ